MVAPLNRNSWSDPNVCDTLDGKNTQVYRLKTEAPDPIVTLAFVKSYLRLDVDETLDDEILNFLIKTCTSWGESYTGRDFRPRTWTMIQDCFPKWPNSTVLRRDRIDEIVNIKYIDDKNVEQTISNDIYYLKKDPQSSQILLKIDKEWPDDILAEEQQITIEFKTETLGIYQEEAVLGVIRLIAYMFENRGDCGTCKECADISGAKDVFNEFRIARI